MVTVAAGDGNRIFIRCKGQEVVSAPEKIQQETSETHSHHRMIRICAEVTEQGVIVRCSSGPEHHAKSILLLRGPHTEPVQAHFLLKL